MNLGEIDFYITTEYGKSPQLAGRMSLAETDAVVALLNQLYGGDVCMDVFERGILFTLFPESL